MDTDRHELRKGVDVKNLCERETTRSYLMVERAMERAHACAESKGWWDKERNVGELLALVHSEVSEALEAYRDSDSNEELKELIFERPSGKPQGFASELADVVIRVFDLAEALDVPLEEALVAKLEYNETRSYRHGEKRA